ncbi:MAG: HNH endonuclease signature motif containing protein [Saprospiraceae bacterium]|nr:HNH endonuclease signature motif containing protein [Saprospiraceae bacterium]
MKRRRNAFHIEHIIPLHRNGSDELENLAFACDGCNSLKWTHIEWPDPESGQGVPLFNSRKEEWSVHFAWNDDFTTLTGLTPEGRATLDLVKMNQPGLVNVRKALIAIGVHPR